MGEGSNIALIELNKNQYPTIKPYLKCIKFVLPHQIRTLHIKVALLALICAHKILPQQKNAQEKEENQCAHENPHI